MNERTVSRSADAVVVGAGPVGMTAAALLASRGINVIVLEMNAGTSNEPKAISIDDEALRTYQQAGIDEAVSSIIVPGTGTRYYDSENNPVFQARGAVPYRLGHPFKNPFAQPDLERVLAQSLAEHELVSVEYNTRVVDVDQDALNAYLTVEGPQGKETISALYVLGADGGRSVVREKTMDNAMSGRSYSDVWLVADTLEDPHTERYGMHHGDPRRPHVIVPGLDGRCRYEFRLFEGEGKPGDAPDIELVKKLVAPYREIEPHQLERSVNYRFNAVNADSYRAGKFFVLGDAAHMMPPFAGQGLNSGIRDAANLTWKIAEVINGKAPDSLLDTYELERKPHAAAIIAQSVRLGSVVMTTNERVARHRDAAIKQTIASAEGLAYFEEMRYRPLAKYDSKLSLTEDAGVAIGQPLVFDAKSRRTARLDHVVGNGWALFGADVTVEDWEQVKELARVFGASRWYIPFGDVQPRDAQTDGLLIDLDGSLYREFERFGGKFVLVRPDHFIAAVFSPEQTTDLLTQARTLQLPDQVLATTPR
ncbi:MULTISPECIES: FAD-dependent monooxygenase [unclassified Glutamicibacter]|uniref:FAD-dependent monooxygenase n=1 Tax=unclassified Glutamicibacter TaxID=2627139 RepID=UPI00380D38BB